ncbi:hypothetical protein Desku_0781 [Desulfofundulus kuznetsovii DSM 6115]|uniref:Uncharacterized protein n=1 Tax=Desulfofundulus kuznetsovii (strain DSM 6115 / VKM B-1805 / 17) TaxID=760568 RepID=A0AAU8P934_DESK7|nr:hypothetical protein Desku_0781 [Desulfofundulus kuznetsovii DSM 6115]
MPGKLFTDTQSEVCFLRQGLYLLDPLRTVPEEWWDWRKNKFQVISLWFIRGMLSLSVASFIVLTLLPLIVLLFLASPWKEVATQAMYPVFWFYALVIWAVGCDPCKKRLRHGNSDVLLAVVALFGAGFAAVMIHFVTQYAFGADLVQAYASFFVSLLTEFAKLAVGL